MQIKLFNQCSVGDLGAIPVIEAADRATAIYRHPVHHQMKMVPVLSVFGFGVCMAHQQPLTIRVAHALTELLGIPIGSLVRHWLIGMGAKAVVRHGVFCAASFGSNPRELSSPLAGVFSRKLTCPNIFGPRLVQDIAEEASEIISFSNFPNHDA
jgi:hypothetical protein